jgi:hypothetical protein
MAESMSLESVGVTTAHGCNRCGADIGSPENQDFHNSQEHYCGCPGCPTPGAAEYTGEQAKLGPFGYESVMQGHSPAHGASG